MIAAYADEIINLGLFIPLEIGRGQKNPTPYFVIIDKVKLVFKNHKFYYASAISNGIRTSIDYSPAGRRRNHESHCADKKPKQGNDPAKPQGCASEPKPLDFFLRKQGDEKHSYRERNNK